MFEVARMQRSGIRGSSGLVRIARRLFGRHHALDDFGHMGVGAPAEGLFGARRVGAAVAQIGGTQQRWAGVDMRLPIQSDRRERGGDEALQ